MDSKDLSWKLPILVLLLGLLPMPYGYYFFSRLVVFIGALFFAINLFNNKNSITTCMFGCVSILYNPIFPIHLGDKNIWIVVNLITAVLFLINKNKL